MLFLYALQTKNISISLPPSDDTIYIYIYDIVFMVIARCLGVPFKGQANREIVALKSTEKFLHRL